MVRTDAPRTRGCEECLKTGDTWVLEPGETWSWCFVDEMGMELE